MEHIRKEHFKMSLKAELELPMSNQMIEKDLK